MAFKFLADHFSITRDSNHFIQIKTLKHPHVSDEVWVAFAVEGESRFARATVQDLMDTFETVFFDHLQTKAYERFENALREVNLIYQNLKEKRGAQAMGQMSAVIAVFCGSELHLAQCHEAEAYLIRKEKLSHISEGLAGRGEDLFINIASGEVMPEDKIIFSTSRLLRSMSQTQLVQSCRDGVTEAIDSIREYMMESTQMSLGVSCIHVQIPYRGRPGMALTPSGFWGKLQSLWGKLLALAPFPEGKKEGPTPPLNRNTLLAVILVIVLILVISVTMLLDRRHNRDLREEYRQQLQTLNSKLDNATVQGHAGEKETANALLDKVEEEANTILKNEFYRTEALELLNKVQTTRDEINNTLRLKAPLPYADLSAKNPQAKALGLTSLDGKPFAFELQQLYEIILDQVLDPKPLTEEGALAHATSMEDLDSLIFLTQAGQVIEFRDGEFDALNTQDQSWKNGVDIGAYGRFLYILNPNENQIYKYSRGNSSYSVASNYNIDADLKEAVSLSVDGNVYVLTQSGEILKLFRGKKEKFEVEGLGIDLQGATKIFTTQELDHLYLLDPKHQRVVVLQKNVGPGARYKGQVQFEGLELKGLYVDQEETMLYVLSPTALYKVNLKDLN